VSLVRPFQNVRAFITIGGIADQNCQNACNDTNRADFVQNLVDYATRNKFDGIDPDIEDEAGAATGPPTYASQIDQFNLMTYGDTCADNCALFASDVRDTIKEGVPQGGGRDREIRALRREAAGQGFEPQLPDPEFPTGSATEIARLEAELAAQTSVDLELAAAIESLNESQWAALLEHLQKLVARRAMRRHRRSRGSRFRTGAAKSVASSFVLLPPITASAGA
jgi:hypothetical protein